MTNVGTVVYIGTLYGLDVCYIALSCATMTLLEIQPLTTYHNDHIWLSRTVQRCIYAISSSDMTDGDSLGQCICRLWYDITSQSSRGNIWLPTQTVLPVYNAYTVPLHAPFYRSKWNVGISRRADFYVDTYSRWGRVWPINLYGCVIVYHNMLPNDR